MYATCPSVHMWIQNLYCLTRAKEIHLQTKLVLHEYFQNGLLGFCEDAAQPCPGRAKQFSSSPFERPYGSWFNFDRAASRPSRSSPPTLSAWSSFRGFCAFFAQPRPGPMIRRDPANPTVVPLYSTQKRWTICCVLSACEKGKIIVASILFSGVRFFNSHRQ